VPGSIDRRGQRPGGGEGPLHASDQVFDHGRLDLELPVVEELDEHRGDQRLVRRAQLDRRQRREARAQIRQSPRPARRRAPRRDQEVPAALDQQVVEMQQVAFGGARQPLRAVEGAGARLAQQLRRLGLREGRGVESDRAAGRPPHLEQMGLARAGRAVQRQSAARPVGPAVDPADRDFVAGGDQEILPPQGRTMAQIEEKLGCRHASLSARSAAHSGGAFPGPPCR
jgi:hypothetical protein